MKMKVTPKMDNTKSGVLDELCLRYQKLTTISKRMDAKDEKFTGYQNHKHPARWSVIQLAIHPAGELKSLAIQLALENPAKISQLTPLEDEKWARFKTGVRELTKSLKGFDTDITLLGDQWKLMDFMDARAPWIRHWYEVEFNISRKCVSPDEIEMSEAAAE